MSQNEESKNTLKISYKNSDDYRDFYANGAYGGMTPRGDLAIDLILDYSAVPDEETYEVTEDGGLGELLESEGGKEFLE